MSIESMEPHGWHSPQALQVKAYTCGHCGNKVSSDRGLCLSFHKDGSGVQVGGVFICPNCKCSTFFTPDGDQIPGPIVGSPIKHVPENVNVLYDEARKTLSNNCNTACVMICRKILMNIAVAEGAADNLKFIEYVEYLSTQGYIPPNGKEWVNYIRKRGNEANHEIVIMAKSDANKLLHFIEMLLKFVYEFPQTVMQPDS